MTFRHLVHRLLNEVLKDLRFYGKKVQSSLELPGAERFAVVTPVAAAVCSAPRPAMLVGLLLVAPRVRGRYGVTAEDLLAQVPGRDRRAWFFEAYRRGI